MMKTITRKSFYGTMSLLLLFLSCSKDSEEEPNVQDEDEQIVEVTAIDLIADVSTLQVGNTTQLRASLEPADATDVTVSYSSSDEEIATVDQAGLVKGIAPGEVSITITVQENPEITDSVQLEITEVPSGSNDITSFAINGVEGTIQGTDINVLLTAGTDITALEPIVVHNGTSLDPESGVAQNFTDPVVYTVTAENGDTKEFTVTVTLQNIPLKAITVQADRESIQVGSTLQLNVGFDPVDTTDLNVVFSSSNQTLASVDANGLVTANALGVVTITATSVENEGVSDSIQLEITEVPSGSNDITSFAINGVEGSIQGTDISVVLTAGTDITALEPIVAHNGTSLDPESGVAQNFTDPVAYTVTAADGGTTVYTVTVTLGDPEIALLEFHTADNPLLDQDISVDVTEGEALTASKRFGFDLGLLVPYIEVSEGTNYEIFAADGSPYPKGAAVDLKEVVKIVVTAEDLTARREYTLDMGFIADNDREVLIAIYQANPNNTLDWKDKRDQSIGTWQGVAEVDPSEQRVTILNLNGQNLISIPSEIGSLTQLTTLNLESNQLEEIPSEIGILSELTYLKLSSNQLGKIPPKIGNLVNLEVLDLYQNQLEEVPSEIGNLVNLVSMWLTDNPNLTCIPQKVLELRTTQNTDIYLDEGVGACGQNRR